jgi:hypothetical protein
MCPRSQDWTVALSLVSGGDDGDDTLDSDECNHRNYKDVVGTVSRLLDRGKILVRRDEGTGNPGGGGGAASEPLVGLGSLRGESLMITGHRREHRDGRKLTLSVNCKAHRSVDYFQLTVLFCNDCGRLLELHWNGVLDPLLPPNAAGRSG